MPAEEWIIHKDAVPAIVSENTWRRANEAMDERAGQNHTKGCRPRMSVGKSGLSGKICCGLCKGSYYRTYRKRCRSDTKIVEWKCQSYVRFGRKNYVNAGPETRKVRENHGRGCDNIHLDEQKLFDLLEGVCEAGCQDDGIDYQQICNKVVSVLKKVMNKEEPQEKIKELQRRIRANEDLNKKLVDKLLDGIISDEDYKRKKAEFDDKLHVLKGELDICQKNEGMQIKAERRIHKITERLYGDIIHKAILSVMLEEIETIEVFRDRLKIRTYTGQVMEVRLDNEFTYASRKEAERERIIAYMRENPFITAKKIAEIEHVSLTAANYRIKKLRQQGRIYFDGSGGHGKWIICESEEEN